MAASLVVPSADHCNVPFLLPNKDIPFNGHGHILTRLLCTVPLQVHAGGCHSMWSFDMICPEMSPNVKRDRWTFTIV